jgi:hypothetical protein
MVRGACRCFWTWDGGMPSRIFRNPPPVDRHGLADDGRDGWLAGGAGAFGGAPVSPADIPKPVVFINPASPWSSASSVGSTAGVWLPPRVPSRRTGRGNDGPRRPHETRLSLRSLDLTWIRRLTHQSRLRNTSPNHLRSPLNATQQPRTQPSARSACGQIRHARWRPTHPFR